MIASESTESLIDFNMSKETWEGEQIMMIFDPGMTCLGSSDAF